MPLSVPGARAPRAASRLAVAGLLSALLVAAGISVGPAPARADSAPANPADAATPATVAADALPTVQINGVVWDQVVVGTTVYAAGSFTRARPAGSPAGTNETVRNNLLAYDITTGKLITGFAPDLNAQAKAVAASPDGSTLYVGGSFTQANGQPRYRIAAYSTATGQLLPNFAPSFGAQVEAIAVSDSAVYVGGIDWGSVGSVARDYLAAVNPTTGAVLSWAPKSDGEVGALAIAPGGKGVVIGGHLTSLNGATVHGLGEVDATTGQNLPFAASTASTDGGPDSGFTSITADGDTIYASAYAFDANATRDLEGVLAIDPNGGALKWVDACHGDSYSVWSTGSAVYQAGHAHDCTEIGGFPQTGVSTDQSTWMHQRAIAFSKAATGHAVVDPGSFVWGDVDWAGKPSPSLLNWFPTLDEGTFTGQYQGPWDVTGNASYVVYGGEFPTVNGTAQQGLVRFAVPSIAPNKIGPDAGTGLVPTTRSWSAGTVRVSWQAASDPDNATLTYDVYRSDKPAGTPVYETTASSTFWNTPTLTFMDSTAPAGQRVSYSVKATDPFGNSVSGPSTAVTVSTAAVGGTASDGYSKAVLADGAADYWRLGESSGTTSYDQAGSDDLALGAGVTLGRPGALTGAPNTAAAFSGTSTGTGSTTVARSAPNVMSVEAWFSTTSTTGGQLIGFGDKTTGLSQNHDRFIALSQAGKVSFNVWPQTGYTVTSPGSYNDGKWHHVVATMSSAGLALYLDGKLVGTNAAGTSGQVLTGYWRVGGDTTWDGSGPYLQAAVDEVAVYPRALTAAQVAQHYSSASSAATNQAPVASFTSSGSGLSVSVDGSASSDSDGTVASYAWDFGDGSTGTGKTASHTYAAAGSYSVKLTVTDNAGATGVVTKPVTVSAATPPPPAPAGALASDAFGRTVSGGWGTADLGGSWVTSGTAANASVASGSGVLTAAAANTMLEDLGISAQDVAVQADVTLDKAATGGSSFVNLAGRNVGGTQYNVQLMFGTDKSVTLSVLSENAGVETDLGDVTLPGSYTAGTALTLRFQVSGSGTSTLQAKAWPVGSAEPASWQLSTTDKTAALQKAGGLEIQLYQGSKATVTQTLRVDNVWAGAAGTTPTGGTTPTTNVAPVASFTSSGSGLSVSVDGSASSDSDGTVASYAWDFGDGSTGTGKTASHTYAAAGSYSVKLTVTDNAGATGVVTKPVTVSAATPPPPAPAGALASDAFGRTVSGGWGTADLGGSWVTSGTAANASVASGSGVLTAAAANTMLEDLGISAQDVAVQADVTLDKAATGGSSFVNLAGRNVGGTQYNVQLMFGTDKSVTLSVLSENAGVETDLGDVTLPGSYTAGTALTLRFQVSGSGTSTLQAKAWPVGSAEPASWQLSTTDKTAALQKAGGLEIQLYQGSKATVTQTLRVDNVWAGAAGTTPTGGTTPTTNVAPVASFTSSGSGLSVSVDGSASSDSDGTVASYAWDFGDGSTGTGKTASHTYAAAGSYSVKLTVTDNAGATGVVTKPVTVSAPTPPPPAPAGALASDAFGRTVSGGWGTADLGGSWVTSGTAANASVASGSGVLTAAAANTMLEDLGISAQDVAVQADVTLGKAATGNGTYVNVAGRNVGGNQYNAQLGFGSDGSVLLSLLSEANGVETDLGDYVVMASGYTPGQVLTVRLDISGSGTTTLHAKAWVAGVAEPATWQLNATDTTAALQKAGGLEVQLYQSSSATTAQTLKVDNVWAGAAGSKP